ncbi:MAG: GC-type dockerin domain-anchored protein [Phycisphaerales bacterium JB060]
MKKPTCIAALMFCVAPAFAQCPHYTLDDGSGGFTIGPSEFDAVVTWGNYFDTDAGCPWLSEVSVSFPGSLPVGTPITVIVYDDPDGDGDPTNATVLSAASHVSEATSTSTFATYDIRPTNIGEGGFFVAIAAFVPQRQSVARLDQDTLGVNSWLFYDGELLTDPGAAPFILRMSESPFNGTWMVRAAGEAQGCLADFDGDGSATIFDFLAFQLAFDLGDLAADFDGDLRLTAFDFLAFQNAFAAGC